MLHVNALLLLAKCNLLVLCPAKLGEAAELLRYKFGLPNLSVAEKGSKLDSGPFGRVHFSFSTAPRSSPLPIPTVMLVRNCSGPGQKKDSGSTGRACLAHICEKPPLW